MGLRISENDSRDQIALVVDTGKSNLCYFIAIILNPLYRWTQISIVLFCQQRERMTNINNVQQQDVSGSKKVINLSLGRTCLSSLFQYLFPVYIWITPFDPDLLNMFTLVNHGKTIKKIILASLGVLVSSQDCHIVLVSDFYPNLR